MPNSSLARSDIVNRSNSHERMSPLRRGFTRGSVYMYSCNCPGLCCCACCLNSSLVNSHTFSLDRSTSATNEAGTGSRTKQPMAALPFPLPACFGSQFVLIWMVMASARAGEYATKSTPASVLMGADSMPSLRSSYWTSNSPHLPICAVFNFIPWDVASNSLFGPKCPDERATPRDTLISWADYETAGGYCQSVNFGQNAPQTKRLGWGHGWGLSRRRCALARQGVKGANASS